MGWADLKDKMNTVVYKGFAIVPGRMYTNEEDGSARWSISVAIYREGNVETQRVFTSKGEHAANEKEAIARSIDFGKKVVDGAIPGASLTEL